MNPFWYVSLAFKTTGEFYGGFFMEAETDLAAVQRAIDTGLIVGDDLEALPMQITEMPPAKFLDRLLKIEDLAALDRLDMD